MSAAKAIITQAPWEYVSSPPCSPARDMENEQQCMEAAQTVRFGIIPRALEPNLWNCKLQLCMRDLRTGIILTKPPHSFQEHGCATRALGISAVSSIPLLSPGDLDKLALHGEGARLILLESSCDGHSSKLPWGAAVENIGGGKTERDEQEIVKNLNSFYPLDQEPVGSIFSSCSDCFFSLQCLQWSLDLEGLWLWVLCLPSGGRKGMGSNDSPSY